MKKCIYYIQFITAYAVASVSCHRLYCNRTITHVVFAQTRETLTTSERVGAEAKAGSAIYPNTNTP